MSASALLRSWVPAILLLAYCSYSLLGLVAGQRAAVDSRQHQGVHPVGHLFEPARAILEGVDDVGFVHIHHRADKAPPVGYYFQAQYALAPTRVHEGLDHEYIVGQFPTRSASKKFIREHSFEVVARFPRGVIVFVDPARP